MRCEACGEGGLLFHGECKLCPKCLKKAQEAFLKKLQKKTWKQVFGFAVVGFFGTVLNGIVYAVLSLFPAFRRVPLSWWIFEQITWAWGCGILAGFVFNFILDKWVVFKA